MPGFLERHGFTRTLLLAVVSTCSGSSFLMGYGIAITNLPASFIQDFLSQKYLGVPAAQFRGTGGLNPELLYALTSAAFVIAAAAGAFLSGWLADNLGRRNSLMLNHAFAIIGGAISGPCVYANEPALLYLGRVFTGINAGITIGVASMYLTELPPRALRGITGATHQLAVTLGILFAYLVTISQLLGTRTLWPVSIGITGIPAVLSLLVLPFLPESPRYLFLRKHSEAKAREAFKKLNCLEDVDEFFDELREEQKVAASQPNFTFVKLFTRKDLRLAVLVAVLLQAMQQLSGINAVINYSSIMLELAGIAKESIQYGVLAIGVVNVIVTIISLPLIEKVGRRALLLYPTVLLAATLLILTITVTLAQTYDKNSATAKSLGIVSLVFIMVYIFAFAIGLGPLAALIVSELFRQGPRAAAYSLSQGIQWTSNCVVLFTYPNMSKAIGGYSFLFFLGVVSIVWIFLFIFLPETKNRTFDDVANGLASWQVVPRLCNKKQRMDHGHQDELTTKRDIDEVRSIECAF